MRFSLKVKSFLKHGLMLSLATCQFSATAKGSEPVALLNFELKPVACIAEYIGQECEMVISVKWQINTRDDLCLMQSDTKLKCWQQQDSVNERLTINLQQSTNFFLVRIEDKQILVAKQVTINFINKYRRRLKPQWSIF